MVSELLPLLALLSCHRVHINAAQYPHTCIYFQQQQLSRSNRTHVFIFIWRREPNNDKQPQPCTWGKIFKKYIIFI